MLPQLNKPLKCKTTSTLTMQWPKERDTSLELMLEDTLSKSIQDQSPNELFLSNLLINFIDLNLVT